MGLGSIKDNLSARGIVVKGIARPSCFGRLASSIDTTKTRLKLIHVSSDSGYSVWHAVL